MRTNIRVFLPILLALTLAAGCATYPYPTGSPVLAEGAWGLRDSELFVDYFVNEAPEGSEEQLDRFGEALLMNLTRDVHPAFPQNGETIDIRARIEGKPRRLVADVVHWDCPVVLREWALESVDFACRDAGLLAEDAEGPWQMHVVVVYPGTPPPPRVRYIVVPRPYPHRPYVR